MYYYTNNSLHILEPHWPTLYDLQPGLVHWWAVTACGKKDMEIVRKSLETVIANWQVVLSLVGLITKIVAFSLHVFGFLTFSSNYFDLYF